MRFRATVEGPVLGQVLELSAIHRDGREFPVELRISEAAHAPSSTLFIACLTDITERKEREAQFRAAYHGSCWEARAAHASMDNPRENAQSVVPRWKARHNAVMSDDS